MSPTAPVADPVQSEHTARERHRDRRARPRPPVGGARRALPRRVRHGARRHDRQRRPAVTHARPRCVDPTAPVDRRRVPPRVHRPAAGGGWSRRSVRTQEGIGHGPRAVRRDLRLRRAGRNREPTDRRAGADGGRCRPDLPGHAGDLDKRVHRSRPARQGNRDLEREQRHRCRGRTNHRWLVRSSTSGGARCSSSTFPSWSWPSSRHLSSCPSLATSTLQRSTRSACCSPSLRSARSCSRSSRPLTGAGPAPRRSAASRSPRR